MRIGNTDISTFNATQFRVSVGHNSLKSDSEWTAGAALPLMAKSTAGFKDLQVTLVVKGEDREAIISNASAILSLLTVPVTLELDGFDHKFRVYLRNANRRESTEKIWHLLELTFEGYECGDDVVVTGSSEITVDNPGTAPASPCKVVIIPDISTASVTLEGICRDFYTGEDLPVEVTELTTNKTVTLDGLTGLVTEDGDLKEVDMWGLPSLLPGENTITCDSPLVQIRVTLRPIYL